MRLVVGLGNPGASYAGHRHNIGFMAVDALVRRHVFSPWRKKFNADVSEGKLGTEKLVVLKPQTFMNNSGQAVGEAMRFYKLAPADVIVIYDELDLLPGKVRIKVGGGAGGHNGIRSIDQHLGDKGYARIRLGIGHPGHKDRVTGYVLSDFAKADQAWLEPLLETFADDFGLMVDGNEAEFMNRIARAVPPSNPKPKPRQSNEEQEGTD